MSLTQSPAAPSTPLPRRHSHSRKHSGEPDVPVRPPSRSERLLRETLVRDSRQRSPRSYMRRAESANAHAPLPPALPDMFDCCIADDDDDDAFVRSVVRDDRSDPGPSEPPPSPRLLKPQHRRASRSVSYARSASHSPECATRAARTRTAAELPVPSSASLARPPSAAGRPRHLTHPLVASSVPPPLPLHNPRSALEHLQLLSTAPRSPGLSPRFVPSAAIPAAQRPPPRPEIASSASSSSSASSAPATPPTACAPAAAFDAHLASAKLRHTDGYVSFAAVEGLGCPPDALDEAHDDGARRGWLAALWARA